MVAMPIVRPILSSNLASFEDNFIHGYHKGAVVFYLSTTSESGQIDKATNEDLASWDPLWYVVNAHFEEYLSFVPILMSKKYSSQNEENHTNIIT